MEQSADCKTRLKKIAPVNVNYGYYIKVTGRRFGQLCAGVAAGNAVAQSDWILLFDGSTTNGWPEITGKPFPTNCWTNGWTNAEGRQARARGLEYQLADDKDPDAASDPRRVAASLYSLIAPSRECRRASANSTNRRSW